MRLAYDELLANQLALMLIRKARVKSKGRAIIGDGKLLANAKAALPFKLTGSQIHVLKEIFDDMRSDERMVRLVQGDVGSGKTIVAFMAMLSAIETGAQAALMAPTEILARQHMESMAFLADAAGIHMELLTGRDKGAARREKTGSTGKRINRYSGRHPRHLSRRRHLSKPRYCSDRRATSFWCSPTYFAHPERL